MVIGSFRLLRPWVHSRALGCCLAEQLSVHQDDQHGRATKHCKCVEDQINRKRRFRELFAKRRRTKIVVHIGSHRSNIHNCPVRAHPEKQPNQPNCDRESYLRVIAKLTPRSCHSYAYDHQHHTFNANEQHFCTMFYPTTKLSLIHENSNLLTDIYDCTYRPLAT